MRFSDSFLDEIRDRVPISSVIGTRVSWDRKKTNAPRGDYWACCPFHGEKSPSFHCEDKKGRYHCFGCGVSGDHFRFLTELDGMSFPEAVERIADMAGVPMPARDPEAEKRDQRARQPDRRHGARHDVLPGAAAVGGRRQGARLSARPRAVVGDAAIVPAGLCARQPQCAEGVPGRPRASPRRRWRPAGWSIHGDDIAGLLSTASAIA